MSLPVELFSGLMIMVFLFVPLLEMLANDCLITLLAFQADTLKAIVLVRWTQPEESRPSAQQDEKWMESRQDRKSSAQATRPGLVTKPCPAQACRALLLLAYLPWFDRGWLWLAYQGSVALTIGGSGYSDSSLIAVLSVTIQRGAGAFLITERSLI
jgi:hypothetical protein